MSTLPTAVTFAIAFTSQSAASGKFAGFFITPFTTPIAVLPQFALESTRPLEPRKPPRRRELVDRFSPKTPGSGLAVCLPACLPHLVLRGKSSSQTPVSCSGKCCRRTPDKTNWVCHSARIQRTRKWLTASLVRRCELRPATPYP